MHAHEINTNRKDDGMLGLNKRFGVEQSTHRDSENNLYMMMTVNSLSCRLRLISSVSLLCLCTLLLSCHKLHSPGITITTINDSNQLVHTIEIDYPGGSYGIGSLAPGKSHVRWIKPSGSAQLRIDFIDSNGEHQAKPLALQSGDAGTVVLHLQTDGGVLVEDNRQKK